MSAERSKKLGALALVAGVGTASLGGGTSSAEISSSTPLSPASSSSETKSGFKKKDNEIVPGEKVLLWKKHLVREPKPFPRPLAEAKQEVKVTKENPSKPENKPVEKKKAGLVLGKPNKLGYYYMPPSQDGSYIFRDAKCAPEHWGSKRLVTDIYKVAQKWRKKYPQGYLRLGDLNGPEDEHKSHKRGIDWDLNATTNGKDLVANIGDNYNQAATIELAKMIADVDKTEFIFYNDPKVRRAVDKHKGWPEGEVTQYAKEHDHHFHVRYDIPKLPYWAPKGNKADCKKLKG